MSISHQSPHTASSRDTLVIVPHYIGSLRYFEKLMPYVQDRYDVLFLLIFAKRAYVEDMATYCKEKGYRFYRIEEPKMGALKRFELYYFLRAALHFKKELPKFLESIRVKKIVTVSDSGFYMRYLFREAARRKIDAMILQWALIYTGQKERPKQKIPFIRRLIYRIGKPLYLGIESILFRIFVGNLETSKTILGGGSATRLGVINKHAYDFFLDHGVPKEKMSIVGNLEFSVTQELLDGLRNSPEKREATLKRLGLDTSKKNITLYSSPFNTKDVTVLSDQEQYEYTERSIKIMREVFPEDRYNLLFKIHPSENVELYAPLTQYGVTIFGKDTNNAELIYFSDLYIAHGTNTNFIAIIARKDAIFINLLNLPVVENSKSYFGIKEFTTDYEDFRRKLTLFREGKLPKQYEYDSEIFTEDSAKKIVEWIG